MAVTPVNKSTDSDLSILNKTFYDTSLIKNAKPVMVAAQFGQKQKVPKGKGKTVEFRKFDPLPLATTPLSEGVTPNGQALRVTNVTKTLEQHGDYIAMSDVLEMTAIDKVIVESTELLGQQAGETIDTLQHSEIASGNNVRYAGGKTARYLLTSSDKLSVDDIKKAVRDLKRKNARKFKDGTFVALIHPDVTYDLISDPEWTDVKNYDPKDLYNGEIGKLYGVRFVETTQAVTFTDEIIPDVTKYTVASVSSAAVTVDEAISSAQATVLANKKVRIDGIEYTISSVAAGVAGAAVITLASAPTGAADGDLIVASAGNMTGEPTYATMIIGQNAYGVVDIEGGGLQTFVKQLGSGGTEDPLNQRSTVGWKAMNATCILVEDFMVRIESVATEG